MARTRGRKYYEAGHTFDSATEHHWFKARLAEGFTAIPHPRLEFTMPDTGKVALTYTPDFFEILEEGHIYTDVKGGKISDRFKLIRDLWPHFRYKGEFLRTVRLANGFWVTTHETEGTR